MKTNFNSAEKIGDIAARFPKAAEIFKEKGIDFCCGGGRPLSSAIREQNLDEFELLQRLENAYKETMFCKESSKAEEQDTDWLQSQLSGLIDHIVNTHHSYMQKELPLLSEMTTKILRVHGVRHGDVLAQVHRIFDNLKMELEQHLIKEEEVLFPLIKRYEKQPDQAFFKEAVQVINQLEDEHEKAGTALKELRRITGQYSVPEDGCNTYRLTFQELEAMEADLFQHIHLENNILFPRFEAEDNK